MEVAQVFIIVISWIVFPVAALVLLWASFIVFRQDVSALQWSEKHPTAPLR